MFNVPPSFLGDPSQFHAMAPPLPPAREVPALPATPAQPGPPMGAEAMLPPNATPTMGMAPQQSGGFLSNILGVDIDQDRLRRFGASLGKGLRNIKANARPLEAFAHGAGAALEGGEDHDRGVTQEKRQALDSALKTRQQLGSEAYRKDYLDVLRRGQDEATKRSQAAAGNRAWNKPPAQLALDIEGRLMRHPANAILRMPYETQPGQKAAAQAEIAAERKRLYGLAGIDKSFNPSAGLGERDNPFKPMSMGDFSKMQPGQHYVNPKDGRVYVYKGTGQQPPAAPQQAPAPGTPGSPNFDPADY